MTARAIRDLVIDAVRFRGVTDTVPRPWRGRLVELLGEKHRIHADKHASACFSAARYREKAPRGNAGVEAVTALVLDFDHLDGDGEERVRRGLDGLAFVLVTSHSHRAAGEDDRCFRVVVALSRELRPPELWPVWDAVAARVAGLADTNARDPARIWFLPTAHPARREHARIDWHDGEALDVDAILRDARPAPPPVPDPQPPSEPAATTPGSAAAVPSGGRHAHLLTLAGALRRKGCDERTIRAAVLAENEARCEPPLPRGEALSIVRSVARYEAGSALLDANHSDLGNAERFVEVAGADLRFVHAWDAWLRWDGRRWVKDATGEPLRRARDTVRALAARAAAIEESRQREPLVRHALRSESAGRLAAMVRLAECLLPLDAPALDRDPWLLNVANGTLDLRTAELRPHDRADLLTRLAPVEYDADARCPRWLDFLDRVLDGHADLADFLQRAVGYSLTGSTAEQVLFLLYGVGANGKSTFVETLRAMLGDHATQAEFATFLARDGEGVRNDIARLVGARFVSATEAESGRPLAEAAVKQMTGGDTVTARFLFQEFFEFRPVFKVWLAANHKPVVRGGDHGIWRRLRLVPFTVTIPEADRDPTLPEKLRAELPGILAWAVRGCLAWQRHGLGVPAEVRAATEGYREEMDVVGAFLAERCVMKVGARVASGALFTAYEGWCEENGERPLSAKGLAMRLGERGLARARGTGGTRVWSGLGLRADGRDGDDLPEGE